MQEVLNTVHLILRPFDLKDVSDVVRLAGAEEVARTTLNIPHPYTVTDAENWINSHKQKFEDGTLLCYAVTLKDNRLAGCVSLRMEKQHNHAELAYWIGKEYWNRGYCTEAAKRVLDYGFKVLKLQKIYASHLGINPASGRVMEKIGLKKEGHFEKHIRKWETYHDLICYGLVRAF